MNTCKIFKDIFAKNNTDDDFKLLINELHTLIQRNIKDTSSAILDLVDTELLEEIRCIETNDNDTCISFGKSLCDIKCIIQDEGSRRQHEIFIQYKGPKKLYIYFVNLPYTDIQNKEYTSLQEIITAYKKYINDLSCYFFELELIDEQCTVVEPTNPTFKDDYRRILIDARTWLHLEVTSEGLAANIHLMGQSEIWQNKLKEGLLLWDHDKNIINNIMDIFDLTEFPQNIKQLTTEGTIEPMSEQLVCSICLCNELPGIPYVPQPLCSNLSCGVYFHRSCLYKWLASLESRPSVFGVVTGSCPSCLQPITCKETDT